jgi:hypothetical protein
MDEYGQQQCGCRSYLKETDLCAVCEKRMTVGCVGELPCDHYVHIECGDAYGMNDGPPDWAKSVDCKICKTPTLSAPTLDKTLPSLDKTFPTLDKTDQKETIQKDEAKDRPASTMSILGPLATLAHQVFSALNKRPLFTRMLTR